MQLDFALETWRPILQDAIAKRRKLESFSVNGIEDLQEKERLFQEAERAIERLRFVGDYLIGRALADAGKTSDLTTEDLIVVSQRIEQELAGKATEEETRDITALKASAERLLNLGNPANQPPRKPFHWLLEFPEVFLEGETKGFSAIVGNPPFQGGQKITGTLGTDYRNFLVEHLANGQRGSADLCAYFFLQANQLTNNIGGFGLVATNTIAQGDTREVGLDQLVAKGCVINRAIPSRPWVGTANLEVAYVWIQQGKWQGNCFLNEYPVAGITTILIPPGNSLGHPYRLIANQNKAFNGSNVNGLGFVLTLEEVKCLLDADPSNKDVLFPYINGEDLNSRPDQSPSRWVINFRDWALSAGSDNPENPKGKPYAADYSKCLEIIEYKVKPERLRNNSKQLREKWWLYERYRPELYSSIAGFRNVLTVAAVSRTVAFTFIPNNQIFAHKLFIFAFENHSYMSLLQSSFHYHWAWNYSSTMKADLNYSVTDCFETFPFPTLDPSNLSSQFPTLNTIGETYYTHRQAVMRDRQEGLTKTYNRFHDPNETADDIQKLRELHIELDWEVANAYGWQDLDLGHDFHTTKQGIRFTISEMARREVLDRLLELNHQRYAEEVAQGLHDKKKAKGKGQKAKGKKTSSKQKDSQTDDGQMSLL